MVEGEPAWRDVWRRPALVLPPLATVIAVVFASWFAYKTIQSNNDVEHARERQDAALAQQQPASAFQLAAVQIVMAQGTCALAQSRARTLVKLFPSLRQRLSRLTSPSLSKALCRQLQQGFFATKGKFSAATVHG
jgi:hypothetical protein